VGPAEDEGASWFPSNLKEREVDAFLAASSRTPAAGGKWHPCPRGDG
jgi:hypothetical protein